VAKGSALKLYTLLDNLNTPRFSNSTLQLPCIAFSVTKVKRKRCEDSCYRDDVGADGLQEMLITTGDKLTQFSSAWPTWQTFLHIRPWNFHDLELPGFDDTRSMVTADESIGGYTGED
jgi:hypothetical protein